MTLERFRYFARFEQFLYPLNIGRILLLLFAQKFGIMRIDQNLHLPLFSLYLNNQPFNSNNFNRSGMYSFIPIAQCSLYVKNLQI